MSPATPVVLLPVETAVRELDARLFLAADLCARRSMRIYLGHPNLMLALAGRMRNVTYCGKNVFTPFHPERTEQYRAMKSNGIRVVYLDEEGAVYFGQEADWKRALLTRMDPRHLSPDDFICAWGEFQREALLERNPALERSIVVTGHPRFDLYAPKYRPYFEREVSRIRERHGRYILINTNHGYGNHRQGPGHLFAEHWGYVPHDPERRMRFVRTWSHSHRVLALFVELVHKLVTELPSRPIVIRPHPSENPDFYRTVTRGIQQVHVIHEGPVGPWLMTCDSLIHDGCTTAIEAHMCGTRIINFRAIEDPQLELYLPSVFGAQCASQDEVVARVRDASDAREARTVTIPERARRLLSNLSTPAIPRLAAVLAQAVDSVGPPRCPGEAQIALMLRRAEATEAAKRVVRPLFQARRLSAAHSQQKFPGLVDQDLHERFERVRALTGSTARLRVLSPLLATVES